MSNSQHLASISGPIASIEALKTVWANHVSDMTITVELWARERAKIDPKWEHKAPLVAAALAAIVGQEGYPLARDQVTTMAGRALNEVNIQLRALGL